jgi:hypothetical protein
LDVYDAQQESKLRIVSKWDSYNWVVTSPSQRSSVEVALAILFALLVLWIVLV